MSNLEEEQPAQAAAPVPCAKGCGFYGNPMTENMCSKCHKETQQELCPPAPVKQPSTVVPMEEDDAAAVKEEEEAQPTPTPVDDDDDEAIAAEVCVPVVEDPEPMSQSSDSAIVDLGKGSDAPTPPKKPIQKNKKRCWTCKKKVGLMGFDCKCDFIFCAEHRYAEAHNCPHDYMTEQRAKLKMDNPTVQAQKLNRI